MTRNRCKIIKKTTDSLLLSKHSIQFSALFLLLSGQYIEQIIGGDFANFCGLLRIYVELYILFLKEVLNYKVKFPILSKPYSGMKLDFCTFKGG